MLQLSTLILLHIHLKINKSKYKIGKKAFVRIMGTVKEPMTDQKVVSTNRAAIVSEACVHGRL